jgi:hypothetical protein
MMRFCLAEMDTSTDLFLEITMIPPLLSLLFEFCSASKDPCQATSDKHARTEAPRLKFTTNHESFAFGRLISAGRNSARSPSFQISSPVISKRNEGYLLNHHHHRRPQQSELEPCHNERLPLLGKALLLSRPTIPSFPAKDASPASPDAPDGEDSASPARRELR